MRFREMLLNVFIWACVVTCVGVLSGANLRAAVEPTLQETSDWLSSRLNGLLCRQIISFVNISQQPGYGRTDGTASYITKDLKITKACVLTYDVAWTRDIVNSGFASPELNSSASDSGTYKVSVKLNSYMEVRPATRAQEQQTISGLVTTTSYDPPSQVLIRSGEATYYLPVSDPTLAPRVVSALTRANVLCGGRKEKEPF